MQVGRLEEILRGMGKVAVAYSAGVDSTYLLRVAHDVLGENVVAMVVHSRLQTASELGEAKAFCEGLGVRLRVLEFDPFEVEGFAENPVDRCYRCKRALLGAVVEAAREEGCDVVVEGSNMDDEGDYRPGRKAVKELGVRSPLQEAGLWKRDIREKSRALGLGTWEKPSMACLASRIASGEAITEAKLRAVERAEAVLFARVPGLKQGRVRVQGKDARVEVEASELARVLGEREGLVRELHGLGFVHVSLDLDGYRTGSMNPQ